MEPALQSTVQTLLYDFITKTNQKKIVWSVINPTVIRWVKQEPGKPPVIVTLQKQPGPAQPNPIHPINIAQSLDNYVFAIQTENTLNLQVNTTIDPSLKPLIAQLYNEAMTLLNNQTIAILSNLLKGV
jgi:hypothetical protein